MVAGRGAAWASLFHRNSSAVALFTVHQAITHAKYRLPSSLSSLTFTLFSMVTNALVSDPKTAHLQLRVHCRPLSTNARYTSVIYWSATFLPSMASSDLCRR